jgi:hypothetical protein
MNTPRVRRIDLFTSHAEHSPRFGEHPFDHRWIPEVDPRLLYKSENLSIDGDCVESNQELEEG